MFSINFRLVSPPSKDFPSKPKFDERLRGLIKKQPPALTFGKIAVLTVNLKNLRERDLIVDGGPTLRST